MDIEGATAVEAGLVALVDIDVLRGSICGKNNLLARCGELVEYLEDDIERLAFTLEILNIVDEQDICFLVAVLEVAVAQFVLVMYSCCLHELVEEFSRVGIDGLHVRESFFHVILDRHKKVGFAQARLAVDE